MAIVETKTIESKDGVKKTIDKQSMSMALDILQRGLYSFPIKSTVRELASNAHDAVKERDVAKAIIAGKEKVEDHFDMSKDDKGIYHASSWDPTYYNMKWLDTDPYVRIYYEEGILRDTLRVVDNGVGLGGERLLGYFQLNYSSKRKNKDTLGRFGLGSKVPLSLGVESFRVTNRYDGMKFKFDVYLDKIESVIPKFGPNGVNESVQLTEARIDKLPDDTLVPIPAYHAYWEPTVEKNGVEVHVEVKKHAKQAFFEAIESQLMYMPNILFLHREQNSMSHNTIDISAKIAYKDSNIIISQTRVYNKPHILLGTGDVMVNYGFVAFNELEIEPKGGAVGLIMDINDIEVTPSREAPVWSSQTRAAVLEKYEKVTETATKYVNEEISKETDYIKWIQKATSTVGSIKNGTADSTSVLATLASIIDIGNIKNIEYAPDITVKLENNVEKMFGKGFLLRIIRYERWAGKVKRDAVKDLQTLNHILYYTKIGANKYKDRYIYEEEGVFVLIYEKDDANIFKHYDLIKKSTAFKNYDEIEIPEDRLAMYAGSNDDDGEDESNIISFTAVDKAKARKANKEISVHTAYRDYNGNWAFSTADTKISDMFGLNPGKVVMYGSGNDRGLMKTLLAAIHPWYVTGRDKEKYYENYVLPTYSINIDEDDDDINNNNDKAKFGAILVAKDNIKYIAQSKRFKTPFQFVVQDYNKDTGKIILTEEFKYYCTSRMLVSLLSKRSNAIKDKYSGSSIFWTVQHSNKLSILFDSNKNDLKAYAYIASNLNHYEFNLAGVVDKKILVFLDDLAKYQLMKSDLVISTEEEQEILLEEINENLPDFMCDYVDEIKDIRALKFDIMDEAIRFFRKLELSWGILSLYESRYYNKVLSGDQICKDIIYYINKRLEEDDASV